MLDIVAYIIVVVCSINMLCAFELSTRVIYSCIGLWHSSASFKGVVKQTYFKKCSFAFKAFLA